MLLIHLNNYEIEANECGTIEYIDPKILQGTATVRGAWPFLAALFHIEEAKFFCGSTIISAKHVLTGTYTQLENFLTLFTLHHIAAAHCVQQKGSLKKLAAEGISFNCCLIPN